MMDRRFAPRRFGLLFVAVCLFARPGSGAEAPGPVVAGDLLHLRTARGLTVSPDGRRVVYVVTEMREKANGELATFRHLWLADLAGSEAPRRLTHGERSDGSPTWSPDGDRLAFVRRHNEKSQIWILPMKGGEAWVLTSAEHGASSPRWSPDGARILFASEIPMAEAAGSPEEHPPWASERPGRDWSQEAPARDSVEASPDGSLHQIRAWLTSNAAEGSPRVLTRQDLQDEHDLEPDLTFTHQFVIDARGGVSAEPLTSGFQDFSAARWSPDGRRLVCVSVVYDRHPDRVDESELWEIPLVEEGVGEPRPLLSWRGWILSRPRFSPDGKSLLFLARDQSDQGYAMSRLAVVNASGGEPRWVAPDLDRSVSSPRWSKDGRWIYFVTRDRGAFPLLRASASSPTGTVETVIGDSVGVRDFDLTSRRAVYGLTRVANPFELYTADLMGGGERRLTSLNRSWVGERSIVEPRERWITRPDGERVQSWVMEPVELKEGEKVPLVLEIHGGPAAMWGPGELTMWHEFQLLTSRGYGVVYSNPRGSSGYGYDFKRGNFQDWGTGPAADVLAALDEALTLPWVDRDRLVVTGGSYAGYLTAWLVSQDQRFKAAVAQRGVYELSFFFGEGNAWRLIPYHFGGFPWQPEAREILDRNSPQTFVENIHTPLLILHSDLDLRTGVNQSEMLYKSLKVLGRPVEYVRYPEEGHDLSRGGNPKRRMDRLNRILEFFDRFVGEGERR